MNEKEVIFSTEKSSVVFELNDESVFETALATMQHSIVN
jgi:hypothetical protein